MLIASRWADVISGSEVITDAGKVYLVLGRPAFSPTVSLSTGADVTFGRHIYTFRWCWRASEIGAVVNYQSDATCHKLAVG